MNTPASFNKILIIVIVLILVINLGVIINSTVLKNGNASAPANAVLLTYPVMSIAGMVESAGNNEFTLKYTPLDGITKPVNFTVRVSDKTTISRNSSIIPYFFKNNGAAPAPLTAANVPFSEIKKGMYVTVNTAADLRVIKGTAFDASMVALPSETSSISGKVVSASGSSIVLKAVRPVTGQPIMAPQGANQAPLTVPTIQEETFTFSIDGNTEIDQQPGLPAVGAAPKAEKISATSIKNNAMVSVFYTAESDNSGKALLILSQPEISSAPNPAQQPASEPATQSASPLPAR